MERCNGLVQDVLNRYGAITRSALLRYLPSHEPRRYLYDILPDYPLRGGKMLRSSLCIAACRAFGGTIDDVIDSAVVTEVFGLACEVVPDPVSGTPMIVPRGRHHAARERVTAVS